ncbi:DUF3958 family protein [Xylocopilactobacillus apicola]|uniref:Uncharacterized protein n=1 Tax=Xylocopilactobacillus apicola TaxID=2932184 RepID=A0AAU9CZ81_9LACO|nr:DUF3958 family protein [Xylocopilactobacillus apicola]BDR59332.1 hypothetical protein XA3_17730 [Xylocopilactobacillus apicola]
MYLKILSFFFEEIGFEFRESDQANIFNSMREDQARQARNTRQRFSDYETNLRSMNRQLETELDEVASAKKQALREESQ